MENILCPKFQFEARYTHILNFNVVAREIISPYLKLATGFNISNQNLLEESIRLNFDTDDFAIEFRWDRAFIIGERNINRFDDENSAIKVFFDILTKLRNSSYFGRFTVCIYLAFLVKISNDSREKILANFKEKYFKPDIKNILDSPNDLAFVLEKKITDSLTETVTVGPYSEEDNITHNLFPFDSSELEMLHSSDKQGKMVQLKIIENTSTVTFKTFKELIKTTNRYSEYLKLM